MAPGGSEAARRPLLSFDGPLGWVYAIGVALTVALTFRWAVAEPFRIPSSSMEPTLHGDEATFKGDRVFVNKWIYGLRVPFMNKRLFRLAEPQRFDIVVFNAVAPDAEHPILIKRIIGLPGERVQIRDGWVTIDGAPMETPDRLKETFTSIRYTSPLDYNPRYRPNGAGDKRYGVLPDDEYSVVPPDHYLVLGDNSVASQDGRNFGWVPNDHLLGRAACVWWPIGRWSDFTGFTDTVWWWCFVFGAAGFTVWRMFIGRSYTAVGAALGESYGRKVRLYVNRFAYGAPVPLTRIRLTRGRRPVRGETVVYYAKYQGDVVILVGQIAAVPGSLAALRSDVAPRDCVVEGEGDPDDGIIDCIVPEGHYFIVSHDGRLMPDSRTLGFIPRRDLIGPAAWVWWPPNRARSLKR